MKLPFRNRPGHWRDRVNLWPIDTIRAWVQLVCFVVLMYGGTIGIDFGRYLPAMSCVYGGYSTRGGHCFLSPLQFDLSRPFSDLVSPIGYFMLMGIVIFIGLVLLLNRGWCGFVCPIGTVQDWITRLREALGIPAKRFSERQNKALSPVKYALLATVFLFPLGAGIGLLPRDFVVGFCHICPIKVVAPLLTGKASTWGILTSSTTMLALSSIGMIMAGVFMVGSFLKRRFWCAFCPLGCLQYLTASKSLLKLEKDGDACTRCGDCYVVCDLDIHAIADDVTNTDIMTDTCTLCLKCISACPENDALKLTLMDRVLISSSEAGFLKRLDKDHAPNE